MSAVVFSEVLNRRVRSGDWVDQKLSTFRKISQALEESRFGDAADLASYFVDEARVCWDLYRQWRGDLEKYLLDNSFTVSDLSQLQTDTGVLTRMPDGSPFEAEKQWQKFQDEIAEVLEECRSNDAEAASKKMSIAKETWRRTHDRDVDTIYAYTSAVSERLGEEAILDMWQKVLKPWFNSRYKRFDVDSFAWSESLYELIYVTFEAMRGHLVGPEREGNIGLEEFQDRYVFSFDPCGSGGRTVRGDTIEGTGPRMQSPYNWKVSEEPHDWNHYTPGVCLYCAHCIILTEQMPMDHFGYPVRVIDPPVYNPDASGPPQQCKWTVYKDPTAVPEEFYTRAGRTKPTSFGSKGQNGEKVFLGDISMRPDE